MKAAVLHAPNQPLTIEDVQIDKPGPREVLIRTAVAGLCHSDLHFIEGKYPWPVPAVLGHESAGVVEAVGSDVTYVKPGDHVITCLSVFCGHCEHCLTGHMSICQTPEVKQPPGQAERLHWKGQKLNQFLNLSSFAEQMLVHEHALVKVREDMPMDLAALIGCGVITGYGAVVHTAKVSPGETVAVIGCGGIGLSAINGAAIAGAGRIIAVDRDPVKLEMARAFGATDVVDASAGDPAAQVLELTSGGVHYAFECVGLKQTVEQSFGMLRPGGTATIIGMVPFGTKVELHGADFLRERRIQGSAMGSNRFRVDMPRLVDFYLQGKLHLDRMVSGRMPLERINEGFEEMKKGGIARNVIVFD
ncbi:Zn-dependent alcohol dehydrogenase [Quisquiliibacterium transsilvanicum]|uniref:S-(Hydroxymethyl)glutathione dehydrogenase/alcohol dehydrogenase n=1 Tax=Quisquiliibacterium transsilvanicum TaxID=1549638 RepID=A0A7W8HHH5_9BURK|nr:Zn-dependent alcohol dehydrogenase [Quisquiliibacterium transsilvanicum]MBB5271957.1 S-(hydroxymethyl)glutathione dehydrogenase/alcohol dehydrogenase [Quisquiliibacterium transsilvanicum]